MKKHTGAVPCAIADGLEGAWMRGSLEIHSGRVVFRYGRGSFFTIYSSGRRPAYFDDTREAFNNLRAQGLAREL